MQKVEANGVLNLCILLTRDAGRHPALAADAEADHGAAD